MRTVDSNASGAVPTTSESSGHSSGTWKQRSSARSLCDYLVIDGPLQEQRANGGRAASRRVSLLMWADQPVPRVARTKHNFLFRTCLRSPSWDLRRHLTTGSSAITQDADRQRPPLGQRQRPQPSCNNAARVNRAAHPQHPLISVTGGGAACALQDFRHCRQQAVRSPPPATLGRRAPDGLPLPPAMSASTATGLEAPTTAVG